MEQYISKSALVAEIERRINEINLDTIENWHYRLQWEHDIEVMKNILSLVNTLEVKEVDLDVMQRMEGCPYRQVGCTMYEGYILECKGDCSWVVDYLTLKQLKAQKGEKV